MTIIKFSNEEHQTPEGLPESKMVSEVPDAGEKVYALDDEGETIRDPVYIVIDRIWYYSRNVDVLPLCVLVVQTEHDRDASRDWRDGLCMS